MDTFYSVTTGGFYPASMRKAYEKAGSWPDDAIAISPSQHQAFRAGLSVGQTIELVDGELVLVDPAPPPPPTREEVEAARLHAYADPLTGSDRHFAEANREALMGNQDAADAAKAAGVARFAEIQAAHPWPPEPAE